MPCGVLPLIPCVSAGPPRGTSRGEITPERSGRRGSGGAEGDHGRAVAAFVRSAFPQTGHAALAAQTLPHRLPQLARAMAMNHADLPPGCQERAIDVGIQLLQGRLDALADQIDLRWYRHRLVEVAPRLDRPFGSDLFVRRTRRPVSPSPGSPRPARRPQLLGADPHALPLDRHLRPAGLQLLQRSLPADTEVAH